MKFLFIHQNFPGQFKHLAPALQMEGHEVRVLIPSNSQSPARLQGTPDVQIYPLLRGNTQGIHSWIIDLETKVIRGGVLRGVCDEVEGRGLSAGHHNRTSGLGESLFLKNVWPDALLKIYCEYFYLAEGGDVGFDKEFGRWTRSRPAGCR